MVLIRTYSIDVELCHALRRFGIASSERVYLRYLEVDKKGVLSLGSFLEETSYGIAWEGD